MRQPQADSQEEESDLGSLPPIPSPGRKSLIHEPMATQNSQRRRQAFKGNYNNKNITLRLSKYLTTPLLGTTPYVQLSLNEAAGTEYYVQPSDKELDREELLKYLRLFSSLRSPSQRQRQLEVRLLLMKYKFCRGYVPSHGQLSLFIFLFRNISFE